jgi:DNA phosphorothioation-associated putative methyltransferase
MEIDASGFDPNFFPDEELRPADVVNLGYVVNVIEDPEERTTALRTAWNLATELLIVSARLEAEAKTVEGRTCGDGVVTGRETFQKFFRQEELRKWIDAELDVASVAAEPGIFYAFRDPRHAQEFLLSRVRRHRPGRRRDVVFQAHQELLEEFMEFVEDHGRVPRAGEFTRETEVRERVGTPRQAFQIVRAVTDEERWDRARLRRYEQLLVYLALSRFRRRPKFSELPDSLRFDMKEFFGSYKAACQQADRALFAIGDQERIADGVRATSVGKKVSGSLYVHVSAMGLLPTVLRVLEGCARELLGTVPDATVVRFDRDRPRVVYLQYPEFDEEAHPALRGAYLAALDDLHTDFVDYSKRKNPPILHRKELFVADDYPLRNRFARLTRAEANAGLFDDPSRIGTANGWRKALEERGLNLRGHQLRGAH